MRTTVLALALSFAGLSAAQAACDDPPGYAVDWHGCDKTDTNLNLANLPGANLSGANLTRANMYGVNFANANLSGANLTDGSLKNANLAGANFSGATWTDGKKVCAAGSVGACN